MAPKKEEQRAGIPDVEDPVAKAVRLFLDPNTHRLLRRIAADAEQSMATYARDVMTKHVQEEAKRRGIKL